MLDRYRHVIWFSIFPMSDEQRMQFRQDAEVITAESTTSFMIGSDAEVAAEWMTLKNAVRRCIAGGGNPTYMAVAGVFDAPMLERLHDAYRPRELNVDVLMPWQTLTRPPDYIKFIRFVKIGEITPCNATEETNGS